MKRKPPATAEIRDLVLKLRFGPQSPALTARPMLTFSAIAKLLRVSTSRVAAICRAADRPLRPSQMSKP